MGRSEGPYRRDGADRIDGRRLVLLEQAAHLVTVEHRGSFIQVVLNNLVPDVAV